MLHKFTRLDPRLYDYLVAHCSAPDPLDRELIEETQALGDVALMQTTPEQAALLGLLVRIAGVERAVEVGTFTGYSALAIARALPAGGHLLCLDRDETWTAIARRYWGRAGVAPKIELRLGDAHETLSSLPADARFDFAFIDADKEAYLDYFEILLGHMGTGGLVCVDNVLWGGSVADPRRSEASTESIRAFNDRLAHDSRVEVVMLPVSDGLTIARKR